MSWHLPSPTHEIITKVEKYNFPYFTAREEVKQFIKGCR